MGLQVGDEVRWSSQAGGRVKTKKGTVVALIGTGESPSPALKQRGVVKFEFGITRDYPSYLVEVSPTSEKARPHLYWPLPQRLKVLKKTPKPEAVKEDKLAVRIELGPQSEKKPEEKAAPLGGPRITKGLKEGVYATPSDLREAVRNKFGHITWDLAADENNTVAKKFYTEKDDAFRQHWHAKEGLLWLNPPFTFIRPWVERAMYESENGANMLVLVPAAVGARWFAKFVFKKSDIYFLNGRITFAGHKTPYPKDCMIIHYHPKRTGLVEIWDWVKDMDPREKCASCKKEMRTGSGCTSRQIKFEKETLNRIRYGGEELDLKAAQKPCPDCAVIEGHNHHVNCDQEECPRCHNRLIGCDCKKKKPRAKVTINA